MTDSEILKKAIEKAEKNGFKMDSWYDDVYGLNWHDYYFKDLLISKKYMALIFSHDFAKAFWGEWHENYDCRNCKPNPCKCERPTTGWKQHLQQMVLESEPLKYLEWFLDD